MDAYGSHKQHTEGQTDRQTDTALDGPPHVHLRVYQLQCDTVDVVVLENDGSASNLMDDLTLLR